MRLVAIILAFAALAPSIVLAQETTPRIARASIEPSIATVGDRLTLTVDIEHPDGTTIEGPRFDNDFGGFEVIAVDPPESDEQRTILRYTLAAFKTGAITLPPLEIRWRTPDGEGVLSTPERTVSIGSVLAPGETDLRPLKPQLSIADEAPPAIVPAIFVVAFVLLTLIGYRLIWRAINAKPEPAAQPIAPLTPRAATRLALDELAASGLAESDLREHYARLAEIVRRYLSERFSFPAYAMTRTELERDMQRQGIDRFVARVAGNLLEQCDAVVFAGFSPPPERVDADLTAAYEIVEQTQPPAGDVSPATPVSA